MILNATDSQINRIAAIAIGFERRSWQSGGTMRSITTRFVVILLALGFASSLIVGMVMYSQFRSYVDETIALELERASAFVTSQTRIGDLPWVRREGALGSTSFEALVEQISFYGESYGLAYIYLMEERGAQPFFIFDTGYYEDGIDVGLPYEVPPPELASGPGCFLSAPDSIKPSPGRSA
jgi:hypothetical protein